MATNAELAARLLRKSATFFRAVAEQDAAMAENLRTMAAACERTADLVEADPTGEVRLDSLDGV